jgi:hypothetical protein
MCIDEFMAFMTTIVSINVDIGSLTFIVTSITCYSLVVATAMISGGN